MRNKLFDSDLEFGKIKILFSIKNILLLKAIAQKLDNKEFSVLFKEDKREGLRIYLADDYYIPKQEVSGTSVDYLEDLIPLRNRGYTVIVHSHPFTTAKPSFSSADRESVNLFPVSIVVNKDISDYSASVCIDFNGAKLQIDAEAELALDIDLDLSQIREKKFIVEETKERKFKAKTKAKKELTKEDFLDENSYYLYRRLHYERD